MKLFWSFAKQAFNASAIYRFDFWFRALSAMIYMYSARWLWIVLYSQNPSAIGVSLDQMVSYGVLGMLLDWSLMSAGVTRWYITSQVRKGAIEMDLLRPLDFHFFLFARNFGETLFTFASMGLPGFLVGFLFLGLKLPSNLASGLLFIPSLFLGYLMLFSFNFLLGMVSIFTLDIRNISWAFNALMRFFSGQIIPLWIFPLFLAKIASFLPFQCVFSVPLSIYIGKLSAQEIASGFALQLFWATILVLASRLVWGRAHARLSVQGG